MNTFAIAQRLFLHFSNSTKTAHSHCFTLGIFKQILVIFMRKCVVNLWDYLLLYCTVRVQLQMTKTETRAINVALHRSPNSRECEQWISVIYRWDEEFPDLFVCKQPFIWYLYCQGSIICWADALPGRRLFCIQPICLYFILRFSLLKYGLKITTMQLSQNRTNSES